MQAYRIFDQKLALKLGRRRDTWDHINEMAIVRNSILHGGMGPIRAPQCPLRIIGHQRRDRARKIIPRIARWIEAIGTGRLEPNVVLAIEQRAKWRHVGSFGALPDVWSPHVIDNQRNRNSFKEGTQFRKDVCFEIDHGSGRCLGGSRRFDASAYSHYARWHDCPAFACKDARLNANRVRHDGTQALRASYHRR